MLYAEHINVSPRRTSLLAAKSKYNIIIYRCSSILHARANTNGNRIRRFKFLQICSVASVDKRSIYCLSAINYPAVWLFDEFEPSRLLPITSLESGLDIKS